MSNPIAQAGRWAALVLAMAACSKAYPPGPQPVLQGGMVKIPAGEFWMGSDDGSDDEKPQRRVKLTRDYLLDEREVTVADYAACVDAGKCKPQNSVFWDGKVLDEYSNYCNAGKSDRGDHPMNCVDWDQAKAYCAFANKRLPTEAEWDRAGRGGLEGKKYLWGDAWPPPSGAGNFADASIKSAKAMWPAIEGYNDGYATTAPGCKFTRNGYGLCDMAGNVWEWVEDDYDAKGYAGLSASDPRAEKHEGNSNRVLRGGSWLYSIPNILRAASRSDYAPVNRDYNVGFRCARTL